MIAKIIFVLFFLLGKGEAETSSTQISEQQSIGCFVRGECLRGQYIDRADTTSAAECSAVCRSTPDCSHFTFFPMGGYCAMYETCPDVSRSECPDCVSGDQTCFCDVAGQCTGEFVALAPRSSKESCTAWCHDNDSCSWWTFDPSDEACTLLSDCDTIDSISCPECLSGKEYCPAGNTILIVSGGYSDIDKEWLSSVETVSLGRGNVQCDALPDLPKAIARGAAFQSIDENPVVCDSSGSACYILDNPGDEFEWNYVAEFIVPRSYYAHAQVNQDWWIMGGITSTDGYFDGTEVRSDTNGHFVTGPDTPYTAQEPIMTTLNSTHLILSGGYNNVTRQIDSVHLFNTESRIWTTLPDMAVARSVSASGIVTLPSGSKVLIVAGGYTNDGTTDSVEMLDLSTLTWSVGTNLPFPIRRAASVPFGDTFLMVGGYSTSIDAEIKTILEYDPVEGIWLLRPEELSIARDYLNQVTAVNSNFIECS